MAGLLSLERREEVCGGDAAAPEKRNATIDDTESEIKKPSVPSGDDPDERRGWC